MHSNTYSFSIIFNNNNNNNIKNKFILNFIYNIFQYYKKYKFIFYCIIYKKFNEVKIKKILNFKIYQVFIIYNKRYIYLWANQKKNWKNPVLVQAC